MKKKILKKIDQLCKALQRNDGFTMIELMIVMVIIGILATASITMYRTYITKTRYTTATLQIKQIDGAILTLGIPPTTEEGLNKLVEEGLIKQSALKDPWGNPYQYKNPGDNGEAYVIWSLGADGKEGGEKYNKDIISTEIEK